MSRRILVCNSQVPFATGGAELLVESLCRELRERGFEVDAVSVPFAWSSRLQVVKSALAWRLLDVSPRGPLPATGEAADLVIATRFPSYALRHPNKVVWLIHQFRQVYDLAGTRYSDYDRREPTDARAMELVRAVDHRALSEARALFTISRRTADRLAEFNDLAATPLYPPPKLQGELRAGDYGDYVLAVGRLDALKRFDLLVEAMRHAAPGVRCLIAGVGPEEERLRGMIERWELGARVELLGFVDDRRLVELYAGARAVFYAPFDEDYGYVTLEAFGAARPVVTCADSGGVLEFVTDGATGFVCPPGSPRAVADRLGRLFADRELAASLGRRGAEVARGVGWDSVIGALTATL